MQTMSQKWLQGDVAPRPPKLDMEILALTNAVRKEYNLLPLKQHKELSAIAARHAAAVAEGREPFSHSGAPERFASCSARCINVAENLARSDGFPREDLPRAAVAGWCGSEGHRRNLLGPFDVCGIGWAASDAGTIFITQLLALLDESDSATMKAKAREAIKEAAVKFSTSTPAVCATIGLVVCGPFTAFTGGVIGGALSYGCGLRPDALPRTACHHAVTWFKPSSCTRCGVTGRELLATVEGAVLCTGCHPEPSDSSVWYFLD